MKKVAVNDRFDKNIDFVDFRVGGMYVSGRLRDAIEEAGLTPAWFIDSRKWRYIEFVE